MNYTINIEIRKAEAEDLSTYGKKLKTGKMFFLKSEISGKIDGPYFISDRTDAGEFTSWFKKGMVYVNVSALVNNVKQIN
jgi:hypothetical protein